MVHRHTSRHDTRTHQIFLLIQNKSEIPKLRLEMDRHPSEMESALRGGGMTDQDQKHRKGPMREIRTSANTERNRNVKIVRKKVGEGRQADACAMGVLKEEA